MTRFPSLCVAILAFTAVAGRCDTTGPQIAKPVQRGLAGGRSAPFPLTGGEAIYKGLCQGCHMPDAKGAVGAGAYPALARNTNLESAGYPISIVLNGQKAMPAFGQQLDDRQIADAVNYVRSHFGNHYKDNAKPQDVRALR